MNIYGPNSEPWTEGVDYEHLFLKQNRGVALTRRGKNDLHVCIVALVEDDEQWFVSKNPYSSHWVNETIELFDDVHQWLRENCDPDPSGFGWCFRPVIQLFTKESQANHILQRQADAWGAVHARLTMHNPKCWDQPGNGIDNALAEIDRLAALAKVGDKNFPINWKVIDSIPKLSGMKPILVGKRGQYAGTPVYAVVWWNVEDLCWQVHRAGKKLDWEPQYWLPLSLPEKV